MIREDRAQELRKLRPQQLIALYRAATGQDELGQLPNDVSLAAMIDAIIEQEQRTKVREPPHAAGAA